MPKIIPKNRATRRATRPCAAHGRTSARLSETPTPIQPLYNHFPNHPRTAFHPRHGHNQPQLNHNLFTTISPTILQPLSNPAPTIGNLNPIHNRPSTATQPRANHNHAAIVSKSHSSRPKPTNGRSRAWQTSTTQPPFVSRGRVIVKVVPFPRVESTLIFPL